MADGEASFAVLNTASEQLHSENQLSRRRQNIPTVVVNGNSQPDDSIPEPQTKRGSKRRRARGAFRRFRSALSKRTWLLPAIIVSITLSLYALNPTPSNPAHRFIFLSYQLPIGHGSTESVTNYAKGPWDCAFVAFYSVVLAFTREFIMQEILKPVARYAQLPRRKVTRFLEQNYTYLYHGSLAVAGLYVMSKTPVWYFNTRGMYEGSPHWYHEGVVKFYYLFQAAYWTHQAIVLLLGLEKPRKDFLQLVSHHAVTLALIGLSYRFHFVYIGLAVFLTHDISDFFLAVSKTLKYLDSWLAEPVYVVFVGVWSYTRHYLNLCVIYSLFTDFKTIPPYEYNYDEGKFRSDLAFWITLPLLLALQSLNLFWFFLILRLAYRFLTERKIEDDRSDDDADEDQEPPEEPSQKS